MRLGDGATRFTTDLDIARASAIDDFSEQLAGSLAAGWEGFTGALVEERQAHPKGVPSQYVMQPFSVKPLYNGKPWVTVDLEVGHNEIGDADEPDFVSPEDANAVLENLGFPPLGPIPVMALRHQIAQKLHAVSAPSSMRAHDLIDLQLLVRLPQDASMASHYCGRCGMGNRLRRPVAKRRPNPQRRRRYFVGKFSHRQDRCRPIARHLH